MEEAEEFMATKDARNQEKTHKFVCFFHILIDCVFQLCDQKIVFVQIIEMKKWFDSTRNVYQ